MIMIFRKLFFCSVMLVCFTVYCGHKHSSGKYITVKPDLKKDLASGSSLHPQLWNPGGGRLGLWVGNANNFDHRYRALLRFDIRQFIIVGNIRKAVLKFSVSGLYGKQSERKFKIQYFTYENMQLGFNNLADSRVKTAKDFVLNKKMKYPKKISIDVSSEINAALDKGYGSYTFRILDVWGEQHGNPDKTGTGTAIIPGSVELDIIE